MVDIDRIRKNPDEARDMLTKRNMDAGLIDRLLDIDTRWRELETELQELQRKQKELSAKRDIENAKQNKEALKEKEGAVSLISQERYEALLEIPNFFFEDALEGRGEEDNRVIEEVGKKPSFSFTPKDHLALGESLGIIDTQRAGNVSGSRFSYLVGKGALLELALVQYAFDALTKNGFEAVIPPTMIRPDVYKKMGRLTQNQKEERYYLEKDDLYLVGSAEHTLGPLYMGASIMEKDLPKRMVGFSSCFRREAGSYGKDVKGILRVHQFDKVEMYSFASPKNSQEEHQFMLEMQKRIYKDLGIPYRVVEICTGDMGPTDARQFDIEAWIPSQNTYREVASCSNTTDYQTRGIATKVKYADGTWEYAHALNATAIAIGRTIIAILENFQKKDGSVEIPKALRKYTGFKKIGDR